MRTIGTTVHNFRSTDDCVYKDEYGIEHECEGCDLCEAQVIDWDFVVRLHDDEDKDWIGQSCLDLCNAVNERLDEIEKHGDLILVDYVSWWVEITLKALPYIAGEIYRDRVDYDGEVESDVESAIDDAVGEHDADYLKLLDRVDDMRERAGLDPLNDR